MTETITSKQLEVVAQIKESLTCLVTTFSSTDGITTVNFTDCPLVLEVEVGDYIYFPEETEPEKRYKVLEVGTLWLKIGDPDFTLVEADKFRFVSVEDSLVAGSETGTYGDNRFPLVLLDKGVGKHSPTNSLCYLSYVFPLASFEANYKYSESGSVSARAEMIEQKIINYLDFPVTEDVRVESEWFINGLVVSFATTMIEVK